MTRRVAPPALLVLGSSTSLQLGLAIATTAFAAAGPLGAVWVRSLVGGGLLAAYLRPNLRSFTPSQRGAILQYALALTGLTVFAYLALADAPLGVVSAILMLGPLTVAAWGQRGLLDLALVALAAVGATVLSLVHGVDGAIGPAGIGAALAAAASFGAYIVAGKTVTKRIEGFDGLAAALLLTAAFQTPLGLFFARPGLWDLGVLATLAVAGVLSTLIPFTLEMVALRRLSMATFGLLLAFEPAVAALVGWTTRGQSLTLPQGLAIALIIIAGAGTLGPREWMRRFERGHGAMNDPGVQALANVPLFAGLTGRELASIAEVAHERQAEAGEVLIEQGGVGDAFFVIITGSVSIVRDGLEVRTLGPGDHLGEIALMMAGPRTATAIVREAATLYVITATDFTRMLKRQPRLEDKILVSVSERMRYR